MIVLLQSIHAQLRAMMENEKNQSKYLLKYEAQVLFIRIFFSLYDLLYTLT